MHSSEKNFLFPFDCYNRLIHTITLTKNFSMNYWNSEVQDLMIESRKESFHFGLSPTIQQVHI
jgi:hypothetical protein